MRYEIYAETENTYYIKHYINYILEKLKDNNYIIEKDVEVDDLSVAKTKEVLKDSSLLQRYDIRRVRANKQVKQDIGADFKGYPFIIVK